MTCVDLAKIMLYLGSCATVHSIFVNDPLFFFDFGSLSKICVLPTSLTGSYFTKANVGSSDVTLQPKKVAKFFEIMLMARFLSILTLHDLISSI